MAKFGNLEANCHRNPTMKTIFLATVLVALPFSIGAKLADDSLDPHLEPLRPFLNKTWKGDFKESTKEKPMWDTARYERILNGKGVRSLHSVNDGIYGGETLFYWDEEKKSVAYFYLTTAGFRTEGTVKLENNKFTSHEVVKGNANGITEVRGIAELLPGGKMKVTSEYFANGKWVPGTERNYVEAPDAKIIFK